MIRTAVIGVGQMGRHHARNYHELAEAKLVAVSDTDETAGMAIAERFGCRFYHDHTIMLQKEEIDAVSVVTPTSLHKTVALDVLGAGKHALVEKPIADTVENAQEIIRAAERAGGKLFVGHIERFNPAVQKLIALIEDGVLGKITSVMARRVGLFPARVKDANVVIDLAVHDVDIINYLLKRQPTDVFCSLGAAGTGERADYADIFLRYPERASGFVQVNWLTPVKMRKLNVTGSRQYAELDYITQELVLYENLQARAFDDFRELVDYSKTPKTEIAVEKKEPLKEELRCFLDCIVDDKPPAVDGRAGLNALEIALTALRTAG